MCFHKWIVKDAQGKYEYVECSKCGKRKVVDKIRGGYQPKKYPNWEIH